MSYDLLVFSPDSVPAGHSLFMEWFETLTQWKEGHSYNDPDACTPQLRAWFMEMIETYPPMNGPFASKVTSPHESRVTDYCIAQSAIYCSFAWSMADDAFGRVFHAAGRHRVGFFDVSSSKAEVWLPNGKGQLTFSHGANNNSAPKPVA